LTKINHGKHNYKYGVERSQEQDILDPQAQVTKQPNYRRVAPLNLELLMGLTGWHEKHQDPSPYPK
jgi:hypothetical protein